MDSRRTKEQGNGSNLFFAKTEGAAGFLKDKMIASTTCECCRTNLFTASDGSVHVVYRDIIQDSIRDMSHVVSVDNGVTFGASNCISKDNWVVNGCPHTGPSIGETATGIHFAWFTLGGEQGIFYTQSTDYGKTYLPRKRISAYGKHPQLIAMKDEKVVIVWEESESKMNLPTLQHTENSSHSNSNTSASNESTNSIIKAQVWQDGNPRAEHWVSNSTEFAEFPVLTSLENGYIGLAWVQNTSEDGYAVFYKKMKI